MKYFSEIKDEELLSDFFEELDDTPKSLSPSSSLPPLKRKRDSENDDD